MNQELEAQYLCYDLKGIQAFIFSVPKLKYICGGSAIIDAFDKKQAAQLVVEGAELLFAGGGKGAFCCESQSVADEVKKQLISEAHKSGLNICFGVDRDYSEAAHFADDSYPWFPTADEMSGHPCVASGLYPAGSAKDGVNYMIKRRLINKGEPMFRVYENRLLEGLDLEEWLFGKPEQWQFMRNVDASEKEGVEASEALGNRNRWAVIAMDGNDMGEQHRKASIKFGDNVDTMSCWVKAMSGALNDCSEGACRAGIKRVLIEWAGADGAEYLEKARRKGTVYLPIRPLVVGGDDIVVLCHASYARTFVMEAMRAFEEISEQKAREVKDAQGLDLWPATKGRLSITAGVLYAPVSLPLSSAMGYAEALMASAKSKGRKAGTHPSPACIDWESVTEGVIDSPVARRQRELLFVDEEAGDCVSLTKRPYTVAEFEALDGLINDYKTIPSTIRHQVLPAMRAGKHDRAVFLARLGKHQKQLVKDLADTSAHWDISEKALDASKPEEKVPWRETNVIDALLLMEEDVRMTRKTVGEEK